ncbi:hypothetical protein FEM41_14450 [Jejubacter calystegiae]|uniref:Uncharacterized protein n=1 Tax=Jejubacter calystegiae TaxID=2579935 RepID=A0A4P8YJB6_9ENTR|nr:hypothetical protein FEM41_14450 [Jejubacter calystegiae]
MTDKEVPPVRGLRLMTKREKTWFFPLCGYQPKINELIFRVYFSGNSGRTRSAQVCHQFQAPPVRGLFFFFH